MKNRIHELRKIRGLTQDDVAEQANTSRQHIARLENGLRPLTDYWMTRLAEVLVCEPYELIYAPPEFQLKPELLEYVTEVVEELMEEKGYVLSRKKKTRVIVRVYELLEEQRKNGEGNTISNTVLNRLILNEQNAPNQ